MSDEQPDDSAKAYDTWWERFYAEHCETPTSLESWQAGVAWVDKRESVAIEALKKIDTMLGNAIGAGAIRRGDMMSEADSRFFWIFDITKEALSKIEVGK